MAEKPIKPRVSNAKAAAKKPKRPRTPRNTPWVPTERELLQIRELAGLGLSQASISRIMGKHRATLAKYDVTHDAWETGKDILISKVAMKLVRTAMAGNVTAMIFFLKAQGGWKDRVPADLPTGAGGGLDPTMKISLAQAVDNMTEQELGEVERAIKILTSAGVVIDAGGADGNPAADRGEASIH